MFSLHSIRPTTISMGVEIVMRNLTTRHRDMNSHHSLHFRREIIYIDQPNNNEVADLENIAPIRQASNIVAEPPRLPHYFREALRDVTNEGTGSSGYFLEDWEIETTALAEYDDYSDMNMSDDGDEDEELEGQSTEDEVSVFTENNTRREYSNLESDSVVILEGHSDDEELIAASIPNSGLQHETPLTLEDVDAVENRHRMLLTANTADAMWYLVYRSGGTLLPRAEAMIAVQDSELFSTHDFQLFFELYYPSCTDINEISQMDMVDESKHQGLGDSDDNIIRNMSINSKVRVQASSSWLQGMPLLPSSFQSNYAPSSSRKSEDTIMVNAGEPAEEEELVSSRTDHVTITTDYHGRTDSAPKNNTFNHEQLTPSCSRSRVDDDETHAALKVFGFINDRKVSYFSEHHTALDSLATQPYTPGERVKNYPAHSDSNADDLEALALRAYGYINSTNVTQFVKGKVELNMDSMDAV